MQIKTVTTLRRSERAADSDASEAGELHDADSGVTLRLNSTGAWIWAQLQQPRTVRELADGLAQHFEIDPSRAHDDVVAFAREMTWRGLLAAS